MAACYLFLIHHRQQCLQHIYTIDIENNDFRQILEWLLQNNNPERNTKILAIYDFDAYSGELNFVLGEAHFGGRVAAIYIPRLRQEIHVTNRIQTGCLNKE